MQLRKELTWQKYTSHFGAAQATQELWRRPSQRESRQAGGTPEFVDVESVSADTLKDAKAFALGCPSMGAEQLEESAMEPFVEEVEAFASGKQIALFGSYGWGDGEWMRDWTDRMKSAGASVVDGEGLIAHETPDDDVKADCVRLGKTLGPAGPIEAITSAGAGFTGSFSNRGGSL